MKICLVQLGRIGDLVLVTGAISALKNKYPQAKIYFLASKLNNEILIGNPYLEDILVYDKKPLAILKLIYQIRSLKFDYWIDSKDHNSKESNLFALISGAKTKIGFNPKYFNLTLINVLDGLHHSQIAFLGLNHLGIEMPKEAVKSELFINNYEKIVFEEFLQNKNIKNYSLINISASNQRKMWQLENWEIFLTNVNQSCIVICSPEHTDLAHRLCEKFEKIVYYPTNSIRSSFAPIANADLIITPDTAIVHIASAFSKKMIALYSGIDYFFAKFYPINQNAICVRAQQGDNGIHSIEPELVIRKYNELIQI